MLIPVSSASHQVTIRKIFTKNEARSINQKQPTWTWPDIPPDDKKAVHDRVNVQLSNENIPEVGEDIIKWRMTLCMRDVRSHACKLAFGYMFRSR
jgi:hypothetical protein